MGRTERMEEEESLKAGKPPAQVSGEPVGQLGLEEQGKAGWEGRKGQEEMGGPWFGPC